MGLEQPWLEKDTTAEVLASMVQELELVCKVAKVLGLACKEALQALAQDKALVVLLAQGKGHLEQLWQKR